LDGKKVFKLISVCVFAILLLIVSGCCSFWPRQDTSKPKKTIDETGQNKKVKRQSERIAFIKDGDIWTMKSDGSDKKQITNTQEYEFSISYSPKAGRIWFIKAKEIVDFPMGEVWSIKVDGTDEKRITAGQLKIRFAAVSPDGLKIGISHIKEIPEIYPGGPAGETSNVWIMDATAQDQTEEDYHIALSDDLNAVDNTDMGREGSTFCAWSPDSDQMAFTFKPDQSSSLGISSRSIYIAGKDGSGRKEIGGSMGHPTFSPNGEYIAGDNGMHWDTIGLKAITTTGEDYKQIEPIPTNDLYSVGKPAWIGNNKITYALTTHPPQGEQSTTTLYLSNLDGLDKATVVPQPEVEGTIRNPAINFTENKIVFEIEHFYQQGGEKTYYIWIVNEDGSGLKKLTTGPEDTEPTWIKE